MNIDRVFEDIGELGPQQLRYCLVLCLFSTYGAWHMLQYTFVGYSLPFVCNSDTIAPNECPSGNISRCSSLTFSNEAESTIVSEWNLVCDRAWLGPMTMSVFMSGVMLGALLLGSMADRVGRRTMILWCLGAMISGNTFSCVVDDFFTYVLLRFINGFFCGGYILSSFVLSNEMIGASKRGIVGLCLQAFFAAGIVFFSLFAYFVRRWRRLTAATSLLGVPLLVAAYYLPESPRWLLSKGKNKEAYEVLRRVAEGNGRPFHHKELSSSTANSTAGSLMDLFSFGVLARMTLIQVYSWFVNSAVYYGLTLAAAAGESGDKQSDRYMATAMSGAVEIPAYIIANVLLERRGRRWTLCGFMVACGVCLLILPLFPFLRMPTLLFCKLCVAASFAIVYIHSSEIFPTTIRNSAMGLVSVAARAGGVFAPFLARLNASILVFGALTLSAGLLNTRLPETQGRPLPDTLQDLLGSLKLKARGDLQQQQSSAGYKKVTISDEEEV